jgi:hypothetical protein
VVIAPPGLGAALDRTFRYWALLPVFVVLLLLTAYPLAQLVGMSLSDYTFGGGSIVARYSGLRNLELMAEDTVFRAAVRNTLVFVVGVVLVEFVLGFGVALLAPRAPASDPTAGSTVCEVEGGWVTRMKAAGPHRWVETGGRPVGGAFHLSGDLYLCNSGLHAVLQIRRDGRWTITARSSGGTPPVRPIWSSTGPATCTLLTPSSTRRAAGRSRAAWCIGSRRMEPWSRWAPGWRSPTGSRSARTGPVRR